MIKWGGFQFSMFFFQKESQIPLYRQLYEQMRDQITEGIWKKNQKLPPTRNLAAEYHISRNTVIQAYEQLEVEGYVRAVTGSGYFVEDLQMLQRYSRQSNPKKPADQKEKQSLKQQYDFYYGNLDYSCYRSKAWRRCLMDTYETLAMQKTADLGETQGSKKLRRELGKYLSISRGVRCSEEQIILTGGHKQSVDLVARMFAGKEWKFAMEDPGYDRTRLVMQQNGFPILPVPLEQDGISISRVEKLSHTLLCVTPSHQFPMGAVLPAAKRYALLQWAAERESYLMEDDYDSELRYHSLPIPSLQSMDHEDRTIYMGTFSKSLSPDLRVAYLVLPKKLLPEYQAVCSCRKCSVPTLIQNTLVSFMESGEYQKHINIMRTYYQKKHDRIVQYFKKNLAEKAILHGENAGLHFVLELTKKVDPQKFQEILEEKRVRIYPMQRFWMNPEDCPQQMYLIGFGALTMEELPTALERLRESIESE